MTGESLRQRCGAHRDRVLLSESTIQSSELQVEMREDVEALTVRLQEAGEQLCEVKTRLVNVKEAAAANKARGDRQVAQLASEKARKRESCGAAWPSAMKRWVCPTLKKLGCARLGWSCENRSQL
jgi:regulator of protease activity HflC (stomatin/prohibitin superfamily)